ncbi:hypothetical protein H0H81_009785, partial [Sphagnurus paluster]
LEIMDFGWVEAEMTLVFIAYALQGAGMLEELTFNRRASAMRGFISKSGLEALFFSPRLRRIAVSGIPPCLFPPELFRVLQSTPSIKEISFTSEYRHRICGGDNISESSLPVHSPSSCSSVIRPLVSLKIGGDHLLFLLKSLQPHLQTLHHLHITLHSTTSTGLWTHIQESCTSLVSLRWHDTFRGTGAPLRTSVVSTTEDHRTGFSSALHLGLPQSLRTIILDLQLTREGRSPHLTMLRMAALPPGLAHIIVISQEPLRKQDQLDLALHALVERLPTLKEVWVAQVAFRTPGVAVHLQEGMAQQFPLMRGSGRLRLLVGTPGEVEEMIKDLLGS